MKYRRLGGALAAVIVGAVPSTASGQVDGAIDTTFGRGGIASTPLGTWVVAGAAVVQPDGKIVTAGEAVINNKAFVVATRLTPEGRPDPRFGDNGVTIVDIGGSAAGNTLALQPDGKVVVAGTGKDPTTNALAFAAVRLLPDGTPDPGFGKAGVVTLPVANMSIANAVAVQPDGRILLAGAALAGSPTGGTLLAAGALLLGTAGAGNTPVGAGLGNSAFPGTPLAAGTVFAAARLNADGSVDRTFGIDGRTTLPGTGGASGIALQPDGRSVLAGQATGNNTEIYMAARLLPDGRPDDSFGTAGIVRIPVGKRAFGDAVALQPDGRIVFAGSAFTTTLVAATLRLQPDGGLDPTFGDGGMSLLPVDVGVNAAALQRDGKILLGTTGAGAIRLRPDGSADPEFGVKGVARARFGTADAANGVATQPDGRVVLSGGATLNGRIELTVIRLNSRGIPFPVPAAATRSIRLTACRFVRLHGRRTQRCTSRRLPGPVVFRRGAQAQATLLQRGRVVAKGTIRGDTVVLRASRAVRRGSYSLHLRYREGQPRRTGQVVVVR